MLGLMVAIENFVARDVLDFSDPVSLSWRLAARSARDEAPRRPVLCAGDSLVKHGLIPKVIAARSGLAAVNLAVARGPAPATFFLFRRALEAGARPAALVVDFKPNVLVGGPRYNVRYWQEILTLRESLDLARSAGSGSLFFELAVGHLLPSFRSRHEIRSNLRAALRGEIDPLRAINRTCQRNWSLNDGANVAAKNPAFDGVVGADDDQKYQTRAFRRHRVNAEYIRRLFTLAAARGIPVYWLLPPLAPQLQARREQTGAEADFVRFVRSFQTRHSQPDRPRRPPCRLRSHTLRRPDPPRRPGGLYPQPRRGRHPPPRPRRRAHRRRSAGSTCPPTAPVPSRWPSRMSSNRGRP